MSVVPSQSSLPQPVASPQPHPPEQLPERVFQAMPWGVLALDRQGVLRLLNPYAEQLLGLQAATVLGQPLAQALPANLPATLAQALHEANTAAEPVTGRFFLPHREQWIEMTTTPGPNEVLVYWQDITQLMNQHQQYQALAENTPDVLTRWGPDLRLRYANPALAAQTGQQVAALLGKTFSEMGAPEAIAGPYMAKLQGVFESRQPADHFTAFPTPGGERYYHSRLVAELHDGQVHTVLAIARDMTELQQATSELQQSKELLEAVFSSSTLALHVLRSVRDPAGQLVDFESVLANASAEQMAGGPTVGQRMLVDWPTTKSIGLFDHLVHTIETGQRLDLEQHYEGEGFQGWYRWTAERLGDYAVMMIEDVTVRKNAEQELRQAHEQLNAIFEAVPVQLGYYYAVRDDQNQLTDLRSATVNEASVTRMRMPNDASGQLMSVQLPGLRELPVWQTIGQVVATGQPQRFELYHNFGSAGMWFDVLYTRLGDGLISASLDITTRKQMEQELRDSQQLLQAVFDATLDSLEVLRSVRDADGQLVDFEWVLTNAAAHRLLQRTDLVGKRLLTEEPEMQANGVFARLEQVVLGQPADFELLYPQGGVEQWFHVAAAPLGDGLVTSWHNITARKQATVELLRLEQAQQQRLANAVLDAQEVERARIAEGLHNGLGQVLYAVQLRLSQLSAALDGVAFARGKRQAEELLQAAISETRTLSHQLTPTVLADFGLATAVRQICQDSGAPGRRLQYSGTELPPLPLPLALALYRMAQELVTNVVQHANATETRLHLTAQNGWLEMQVDDNGRGFDPALPRPDRRGLSALRDRVQLLNGELTVTSSADDGTHVRIRVPLEAIAARPSA
ncbi:PAS domain-containing protein [Hymenobacter negativus]|uniref:histidine kinase n=1 Tax=Hymenobacter negativus TaxID=2795026 RepID=A0ABS3QFF0_9BACT|nr:PAS domain-containing protein [Hymenobacter negativus]MBO2009992.1 PAS domain-containing protein [Hymenobacter negativus]